MFPKLLHNKFFLFKHSFYEKSRQRRKNDHNDKNSGHYVVAVQPPERWPTRMPSGHAYSNEIKTCPDIKGFQTLICFLESDPRI